MDLPLRLQAALSLLGPPPKILADIGTDHAKLPIAALEKNLCPAACAIDKNPGPWQAARDAVPAKGLGDRIIVLLGDGLQPLRDNHIAADAIIIAGLGGETMLRIFEGGRDYLERLRKIPDSQMILQPQTDVPLVRSAVFAAGFAIVDERLVFENNHYYEILKAGPLASLQGAGGAFSDHELVAGRFLKPNSPPALWQAYAASKIAKLERAIKGREQSSAADPEVTADLQRELDIWRNA